MGIESFDAIYYAALQVMIVATANGVSSYRNLYLANLTDILNTHSGRP